MRPWVHLPVASHAAVAIEFALSDEYANRIHEILSNDYQSYIEPVEGGYITHSVENQIKDNISDFRTRLRTNISDWYCNHIPGVLTSSSQGSNLPTVELTLFDYEEPFEGERGCGRGYYLDLMRMSRPFNAWESKAYDGLKIGSLGTRDWRAPHLVATANRAHLFEGDDLGGWGGRTDSGFRNRLNSFHAWVTYWGLTQLLSAYETTMSSIRDGMLATNGNTNADDLLGLAGDLRAFERDCIPFLTDFDQHYDRDGSFDYRSFGFERIEPRWQDSTPNLLESVRANIAFRGQHLSKLIDDLGDSIIGSASLASTSSSRTLQRRIHILTWVVALSALVTLGQALSDIGFVSNIYDSVVVGVQSVVGDIS